MKLVNYDLPIDKTSALVVSKCSDYQIEFNNSFHITSMAPLPTCQFTGPRYHDLTGKRNGRLLVIGCALYKTKAKVNSTRWVVRCACGRYQMQSTKAIKKDNPDLMCIVCYYNHRLKKKGRPRLKKCDKV